MFYVLHIGLKTDLGGDHKSSKLSSSRGVTMETSVGGSSLLQSSLLATKQTTGSLGKHKPSVPKQTDGIGKEKKKKKGYENTLLQSSLTGPSLLSGPSLSGSSRSGSALSSNLQGSSLSSSLQSSLMKPSLTSSLGQSSLMPQKSTNFGQSTLLGTSMKQESNLSTFGKVNFESSSLLGQSSLGNQSSLTGTMKYGGMSGLGGMSSLGGRSLLGSNAEAMKDDGKVKRKISKKKSEKEKIMDTKYDIAVRCYQVETPDYDLSSGIPVDADVNIPDFISPDKDPMLVKSIVPVHDVNGIKV